MLQGWARSKMVENITWVIGGASGAGSWSASLTKTWTVLIGFGAMYLGFLSLTGTASVSDSLNWANATLGPTYLAVTGFLVIIVLTCLFRILDAGDPDYQSVLVAGRQAAAGIGIVALVYTLHGIGEGIGELAVLDDVTSEAVRAIIPAMAADFRLAFKSSEIGIPIAFVARSLIAWAHARNRQNRSRLNHQ